MSLIKFWNKLKYWQKGAMLGLVPSFVFLFLFSLYVDSATFKSPEPVSFGQAFVYVIPATILGSIIGLIIGKFIKK